MKESLPTPDGHRIHQPILGNMPATSVEVREQFSSLLKGDAERKVDFYTAPQRLWDFLQRLNFDGIATIHRNEWDRLREIAPESMKEFERLINERVRIEEGDRYARVHDSTEDIGTEKFVPEILPTEMLQLTQIINRFNASGSEDEEKGNAEELLTFVNSLFSTKLVLRRQAENKNADD